MERHGLSRAALPSRRYEWAVVPEDAPDGWETERAVCAWHLEFEHPLAESIVLLSTDDEIEPEVATRGLEDIASCLASLTPEDQRQFLGMCVGVAQGYEGAARHEVPAMIAETLGLTLP